MLSKNDSVQCLRSKDTCVMGNEYDCKKCAYSIPTLAVIREVSMEFYESLLEYHKEECMGEKIKLSVTLNHQLEIISQAIERYGHDLVYSFMGGTREEVSELFSQVDEPLDIYEDLLYLEGYDAN